MRPPTRVWEVVRIVAAPHSKCVQSGGWSFVWSCVVLFVSCVCVCDLFLFLHGPFTPLIVTSHSHGPFTSLIVTSHSHGPFTPPICLHEYAERGQSYCILFKCSLFCEYVHLENVRVPVTYRVNQAEYLIRILVIAPQEYVNTYSTRRPIFTSHSHVPFTPVRRCSAVF